MAFQLPVIFADLSRRFEEERRRREEEEKKRQEELRRKAGEFKEKLFVEPIRERVEFGKRAFRELQKPELPTRVVEKIEKLPEPPRWAKAIFPPAGYKEAAKFATAMLFGTEEERRKRREYEEITGKVFRGEKIAPEEKLFARKYGKKEALELGIAAAPIAPQPVRMTPQLARSILKVRKGASTEDIRVAYTKLLEKEFPERLVNLAKKYEVDTVHLIFRATDALWTEATGKALMVRPVLEKEAERGLVRTFAEYERRLTDIEREEVGFIVTKALGKPPADWVRMSGTEQRRVAAEALKRTTGPIEEAPLEVGYRAETKVGFGATEGRGLYIAETKEFAQAFAERKEKIRRVEFKKPRNPLIVDEEPLPLLQEDFPLFEPIRATDSEWIKLNKQAVKNIGATSENWGKVEGKVADELTRLMKEKGYDAVKVSSGGEKWTVILDEKLLVKAPPVKPAVEISPKPQAKASRETGFQNYPIRKIGDRLAYYHVVERADVEKIAKSPRTFTAVRTFEEAQTFLKNNRDAYSNPAILEVSVPNVPKYSKGVEYRDLSPKDYKIHNVIAPVPIAEAVPIPAPPVKPAEIPKKLEPLAQKELIKRVETTYGFLTDKDIPEVRREFGNIAIVVKDVNGQRARMSLDDFIELSKNPAFSDRVRQVWMNRQSGELNVKPQFDENFMEVLHPEKLLMEKGVKQLPEKVGELPSIEGIKLSNLSTVTRPQQERFVEMITDVNVRDALKKEGIREINIQPPYKFRLSEQANLVKGKRIINISADAIEPKDSILHELGHARFEGLTKKEQEALIEFAKQTTDPAMQGYKGIGAFKEIVADSLYKKPDFYTQATKVALPAKPPVEVAPPVKPAVISEAQLEPLLNRLRPLERKELQPKGPNTYEVGEILKMSPEEGAVAIMKYTGSNTFGGAIERLWKRATEAPLPLLEKAPPVKPVAVKVTSSKRVRESYREFGKEGDLSRLEKKVQNVWERVKVRFPEESKAIRSIAIDRVDVADIALGGVSSVGKKGDIQIDPAHAETAALETLVHEVAHSAGLPEEAARKLEKALPVKPKRVTLAQIEKVADRERFGAYLVQAKTPKEYIKRTKALTKQLARPEVQANKKRLKEIRVLVNQELKRLTGFEPTGGLSKTDYAVMQLVKDDPDIAESAESLENLKIRLDELIGARIKKQYEVVQKEAGLPLEGKYYIPYGRYTTKGTGNREWVQTNLPLVYMGNKRSMVGYILDALGIKQKDLPSIVPADVKHLAKVKRVVDVFGGSGLLSNLSKKFFPNAKITFNELDPKVIDAIRKAQKDPKSVSRFVSEIALWLKKHPDADWLAHFSTVYKEDPDFIVAARLIEATAGRTRELTPTKLGNLLEAIPNFSKAFKDVEITHKDGMKILDRFARSGTSKDFLWIDPPYLWSTGYTVGAEMERAEGFMKLLNKIEKLDKKGVRFIFFNNDPVVQSDKAKLERVHLDNIVGRLNRLTENMLVAHDVKPIGTPRREVIVTNLPYGRETGRFLIQSEVEAAIAKLRDDPAAAPREVLKMLRELRLTSRFIPEGERISAGQIRQIRILRKRMRIKNRELVPMLDELLGDTSFAKMTKEDGVKLLNWLRPQNWEIIESKLAQTREMLAEEKRQLAVSEPVMWKDAELEDKYGGITTANKTISEIIRFGNVMRRLPEPKPIGWARSYLAALTGKYLPQPMVNDILGMYHQFQIPMQHIVNIPNGYVQNISRWWDKFFGDLSKEETMQVIYIQEGAEKYYEGKITPKARRYAKYFQELMNADYTIKDRLEFATSGKHLGKWKPYMARVLDENIRLAAEITGKSVKFWEGRLKTPKDFAAGLFSKDPVEIKEAFLASTEGWMRKKLYQAFLMDRVDKMYDVSKQSGMYARAVVESEIYNMQSTIDRLASSVSLNDAINKIAPRRIKVSPELLETLNDSLISSKIKVNKDGTIDVPAIRTAGAHYSALPILYSAKLGGVNLSYSLLQLAQTSSAAPFVGFPNYFKSLVEGINIALPRNKAERQNLSRILELAGYEKFIQIGGYKFSPPKNEFFAKLWKIWNFLPVTTDLYPRYTSLFGGKRFLEDYQRLSKFEFTKEDKERFGAAFSAVTNFLGGRGYAPLVTRRSFAGKLGYMFVTWPLNQVHWISKATRLLYSDKNFANFVSQIADAGLMSDDAYEQLQKMPPKAKANIARKLSRLIFLLAAAPLLLYAVSKSWNVASRGLVNLNIPDSMFLKVFVSFAKWMADSSSEEKVEDLKRDWKAAISVSSIKRVADILDVYNYGMVTTSGGRPVFIEKTLRNYWLLGAFGRSALPEYEKAYPSILSIWFGGNTEADMVRKLQKERGEVRDQEEVDAVQFLKLQGDPAKIMTFVEELKREGRYTEGFKEKVATYLKERARGVGALERRIIGLKDVDQARLILDELDKTKDRKEKLRKIGEWKRQGIITENVLEEIGGLMLFRQIQKRKPQPEKPFPFPRGLGRA